MCRKWALNLLEEVKNVWEIASSKDKNNIVEKNGFAVFYSKVRKNPELMIIGYNPGGGDKDFNIEDVFNLEKEHEYIKYSGKNNKNEKYKTAVVMYNLFEEIGKLELLEKSVKLNLIFFRSKSKKEWLSLDKELRISLEQFCFGKVKEIVDYINPKIILLEGLETFDLFISEILNKRYGVTKVKITSVYAYSDKSCRRLFAKTEFNGKKLLGIIHPSYFDGRVIKYLEKEL
ncbi:hypothetical protein DEFDS_0886 [Deferribacter desulfuricans SSM1]|uniref:Uracil-DNA glycosylase-like domain-containing protein n=1 Tax=Deferribacter desulfuricans (strain DSM 14783 / JCM 11476 / NBRC 101012 / SSM1) TaxID=639282 RepID=D3PCN9_DEFDS|nr:hypothetical protein [Deferribacter desulfuricans]BAI80362.1 hypothetical protein DEFDS_0886 [Deferribacter desulfuricans SSM1]